IHVRILEVSPFHEPTSHPFPLPIRWGEGGRRSGEGWFMVPMRAQKRKEAVHEPCGCRVAILAAGSAGILACRTLGGRHATRTGRLEARPTCLRPNKLPTLGWSSPMKLTSALDQN